MLTLLTNKILPEPDTSKIFLWSLAVSLQTAVHMWSHASENKEKRAQDRDEEEEWLRQQEFLITRVAVLIPGLLIKVLQSYVTLTWHAVFSVGIWKRRDC